MWKVCFSEKKEKISLSLHIKTSFSLCITHHRGATLSLFHEKEVKEEEEDSKEFIDMDMRVKLRQKAQLAELCSRWVGTNILLPFLLFFSVVCVSLRVKSQRVF